MTCDVGSQDSRDMYRRKNNILSLPLNKNIHNHSFLKRCKLFFLNKYYQILPLFDIISSIAGARVI